MFKHDDHIRVGDGAEPMGDDERGAVAQQFVQSRLNQLLALGVKVAGGLVEYQDLRIGQQGAGDAEPLPLAAGELEPRSPMNVS